MTQSSGSRWLILFNKEKQIELFVGLCWELLAHSETHTEAQQRFLTRSALRAEREEHLWVTGWSFTDACGPDKPGSHSW